MKISFIVTYYNQKNFVKDSLASILAIDFPCNYEILIGDDGSTDGTVDEIKRFCSKYPNIIKYFVMPRDNNITYDSILRVSANRLNALKHATGDYVMFLDGDDFYCDKDFVKLALEQFYKNNNIVACAFGYENYFPKGNKRKECFLPKVGLFDVKKYVERVYTPSGAVVFRNIFDTEKIKLLEKNKIFDDNLITIFALQFGKLYCFKDVIYTYRQCDGSSWNSKNDAEKNLLNAMDFYIISTVSPKFKKELLKRQWFSINQIYRHRHVLYRLIVCEKYINQLKENNDVFVLSLLMWNKISLFDKLKTVIKYWLLKWRVV